jgi:transposase
MDGMALHDARKLAPGAQEDLRRRVIHAVVHQKMRPSAAVRTFRVSRTAVYNWMKAHRAGGRVALRARPRGRPRVSRLAGHQAALAVRLITDRCPDQLKMPFALWTREAVRELLAERFDLKVSVWTVGRYLAGWGLTPQKPLRRAYERDPAAVKRWLKEEFPAIRAAAKREKAEIHWGDQMGLRSDHQAGTSYGRRGRTPVISATGQRFGCNMMSTLTNRGVLTFMVFKRRFTAPVCIQFLRRLIRQRKRKVLLVLDRHPVHRSAKVQRWIAQHADRLRLFYLPGYSPELNPDEYLNHDVKDNAVGRTRPATQAEMITLVRGYLRIKQARPTLIEAFFNHPSVQW